MANRSLAKPKKSKRRGVQVWNRTPIREMGPSIVPLPPLTVTPHDNEIMGAPQVVAIYWGTAFNTGGTGKTALAINLDNFFQRLLPSRYMSLLSEYGVGSATFVGSVCLPHDAGTPETMNEAALETKLRAWLDGSLLPRIPGPNESSLLFAIFIPPEITVTGEDADGGCAYHKAVKYQKGLGKNNLFYSALKWPGTGSSAQDLAALTGAASHELVEAFTNRSSGRGWYDDGIGYEIGDACSSCRGPGLFDGACPYPLSSYWLQSLRRCLREADVSLAMDINRNQDGRIELVASAPGYGLWHAWQTRPGVDQWSSGGLGAPPGVQGFLSGPAVFSNDDGRLEVFIVGIDGQLWHIYQTVANNGWSSWGPLGRPMAGIQSTPAVFKNQDGRLEVFVIGTDGALWHNWQEQKNQQSNAWPGWFSLGVPSGPVSFSLLADPAVSINIDGGLAVFAVGGDGQVWYIFQTTADKTVWSNWRSLAPPQPYFFEVAPEVTRNVAGEIQFFLVDRAGPFRSLMQTAPGDIWSPTWLNITLPAQVLLGPTVTRNSSGLLEVLFVGDDGALWNIEQTSQSDGSQSWSGVERPGKSQSTQPGCSSRGVSGANRYHRWRARSVCVGWRWR